MESWGEALLYGKPGTIPNDRPTICFKRKAMARVQDDQELVRIFFFIFWQKKQKCTKLKEKYEKNG